MHAQRKVVLRATILAALMGTIGAVAPPGTAVADHNTPFPGDAVVCQYRVTSGSTLRWYQDHNVNTGVAARTPAGTLVTAYRDHTVRTGSVTFRPRGSRSDPIWANAGRLARTSQPCLS